MAVLPEDLATDDRDQLQSYFRNQGQAVPISQTQAVKHEIETVIRKSRPNRSCLTRYKLWIGCKSLADGLKKCLRISLPLIYHKLSVSSVTALLACSRTLRLITLPVRNTPLEVQQPGNPTMNRVFGRLAEGRRGYKISGRKNLFSSAISYPLDRSYTSTC